MNMSFLVGMVIRLRTVGRELLAGALRVLMAGISENEIKDIRLEKAGDKIKPSGEDTQL